MNTRKRLRWKKFISGIAYLMVIINVRILSAGFSLGPSMLNTLPLCSFLMVNKYYYINHNVSYGDIVMVHSETGKLVNKRIIGLPGDVIDISNDRIYLNGYLLDESDYLDYNNENSKTISIFTNHYEVPEGCVFVLGDCRMLSGDARIWSNPYISIDDIKGKYMGHIPLPDFVDTIIEKVIRYFSHL